VLHAVWINVPQALVAVKNYRVMIERETALLKDGRLFEVIRRKSEVIHNLLRGVLAHAFCVRRFARILAALRSPGLRAGLFTP
jgi:hypothetical protein